MKVSVIIPVYNGEEYLQKCLDSVLAQSLKEIEIICVDDGSTDKTPYILCDYAKRDNRIKIITQKNRFAGVARNHGMKYAKGKYLAFLDADDYFEPDMLERMYQRAEDHASDIVICRYIELCERTHNLVQLDWSGVDSFLFNKIIFSGESLKNAAIFQITKGWTWDKLFRTEFVKKCGYKFPDFRSSEDGFFVFMLLARAMKISYMDNSLVVHRVNNKNSLSSTMETDWLNGFKMLLLIQEELRRQCLYEVYQQSFLNEVIEFLVWYISSMCTFDAFKKCYLYTQMVIEPEIGVLKYEQDYYFRNDLYDCYKKIIEQPFDEYLFQQNKENIRTIGIQHEALKSCSNKLAERGWVFPYRLLEKDKKVVLYGAGEIGKSFYSQLLDSRFCKEVIWVDRRFKEYVAAGEPVSNPEMISTLKFDYVFLAVKNEAVQQEIKEWLLEKGVKLEQIKYYRQMEK